MRCRERPKLWGLFPRGHEWRRITSPFIIEAEDDAIEIGVKVLVGATCSHCGEPGLIPPSGGWSVRHIHRSLAREEPWLLRWSLDEGVVTTYSKALDFVQRVAGGAA